MKHHKAFLAAAALAITATLTGCNHKQPATTAPGPPKTGSASPSTTPAGKPLTYTMPANLCTAVTAAAFADLVPGGPSKTSEMGRGQTTKHSSSTCIVILGTLSSAVLVGVGVDLWTDIYGAQDEYEGFRSVVFKDYPGAHDVTGAGTAAYFFTDKEVGPHLVLRHGNVHLSVWAVGLGATAPLPSNIADRLITTAKAALEKLPTTAP